MSATTTPTTGSFLMPSLEHATVADVMHPGILSCDPDASMTEVARMMATHHVHCIVVIGISHEAGERLVWSLVSDLDLVREGLDGGTGKTARSLALEPIITVEPSTPLREAAGLMIAHNQSHVVVMDAKLQRPVGVLSTLDIAGTLAWGEF